MEQKAAPQQTQQNYFAIEANVLAALIDYLRERPVKEVEGFLQLLRGLPRISVEKPAPKEEAPVVK